MEGDTCQSLQPQLSETCQVIEAIVWGFPMQEASSEDSTPADRPNDDSDDDKGVSDDDIFGREACAHPRS